jgi:hypothetical protein
LDVAKALWGACGGGSGTLGLELELELELGVMMQSKDFLLQKL